MKQIFLALALTLPAAVAAEDATPPADGDMSEGLSLMEEGAKLLFRGILNEMEPAIDEFGDLAQDLEPALELLATEMGPALMELFQTLDSIRHYEAPEILPNGDIIIRRSPDAPVYVPRGSDPIDL